MRSIDFIFMLFYGNPLPHETATISFSILACMLMSPLGIKADHIGRFIGSKRLVVWENDKGNYPSAARRYCRSPVSRMSQGRS
jgi:hypothetical protein